MISALKKTGFVTKFFVLYVLASYIVMMYVGYLMFYPFRTVEVQNSPFPVLNSPVTAGQIVVWQVKSCRYTEATAEVTRTLVGSVNVQLSHETSSLKVGCQTFNQGNTIIPSYAPAGTYHIEIHITYKINPLRTIEKQYSTQDFDIKRPEAGASNEVLPPVILQQNFQQPNPNSPVSELSPSGSGSQDDPARGAGQESPTTEPPRPTNPISRIIDSVTSFLNNPPKLPLP